MLDKSLSRRGADVAIDLGSSAIRLVRRDGIVLEQPSVVAVGVGRRAGEVAAWGDRARELLGRTSTNLRVIRPIQAGVVTDFQATEQLVRCVLREGLGRSMRKPRVLVTVPPHCTEVERRAVRESVRTAGAREVLLVHTPILAGLGAELDITAPRGSLLLEVGGGLSTCAVLSLGGLVVHHSEAVGGVSMDAAIRHWMRRVHGLVLGDRSAEALKLQHGNADGGAVRVAVRGRDLTSGGPREVAVSGDDLANALRPLVTHIRSIVFQTLAATPPELSGDIIETGALVTGGAGQLRGLDRVLRDATELPFLLAEQPMGAVSRGAQIVLEDAELTRRLSA